MARLGVNLDHIATLRQARGGIEPDPIRGAVLTELAGADGIVVHLREDRRHIQEKDLRLLREVIQTKLNLEMAPIDEMVKIALSVKPHMVTFVPERREELTTEGGLDVARQKEPLEEAIRVLHDNGIGVSLFIDPDVHQIKVCRKIQADFVEIHTGRYANAQRIKDEDTEFEAIRQAARLAYKIGLGVAAGHGLNYRNVRRFKQIPEIVEYNIGHAIISRAMFIGLEKAVDEMKNLLAWNP